MRLREDVGQSQGDSYIFTVVFTHLLKLSFLSIQRTFCKAWEELCGIITTRRFIVVASRDLDSPITVREQAAVNEWLSSNRSFHVMRDHPHHGRSIMGGMWGYRPLRNVALSRLFLSKLRNATLMKSYTGVADQDFLHEEVWPLVKHDLLAHDSYHCEMFGTKALPFPTQRSSFTDRNLFVGCIRPCSRSRYPLVPCPISCRPKQHQDWIYC